MKFNPFDMINGTIKAQNPIAAMAIDIAHQAVDRSPLQPGMKEVVKTIVTQDAQAAVAETEAVLGKSLTIAPVKSAWVSKINWIQFAGPVAAAVSSVIGYYGFKITPEEITGVVSAILLLQSFITWIIRTWFTRDVVEASVKKPS